MTGPVRLVVPSSRQTRPAAPSVVAQWSSRWPRTQISYVAVAARSHRPAFAWVMSVLLLDGSWDRRPAAERSPDCKRCDRADGRGCLEGRVVRVAGVAPQGDAESDECDSRGDGERPVERLREDCE